MMCLSTHSRADFRRVWREHLMGSRCTFIHEPSAYILWSEINCLFTHTCIWYTNTYTSKAALQLRSELYNYNTWYRRRRAGTSFINNKRVRNEHKYRYISHHITTTIRCVALSVCLCLPRGWHQMWSVAYRHGLHWIPHLRTSRTTILTIIWWYIYVLYSDGTRITYINIIPYYPLRYIENVFFYVLQWDFFREN